MAGFFDFLGALGSGIGDLFGGGAGGAGIVSPEATQVGYQGFAPGGQFASVPTAPAGGGGFWESLGGGLSDLGTIAQNVVTSPWLESALKLGTTGMGIYSGVKNMQLGEEQMDVLRSEQERLAGIAAPAAQAGGALTAAGHAALLGGALPPDLEAQVESFKNDARMRYRQYLSSIGQTDSSAAAQIEGWVDLEAKKFRSALAQQLLESGYSGVNTALRPSLGASQTAGNLVSTAMGGAGSAQQNLWKILGAA